MPEPTPGQRRVELYVREGLPAVTRECRRDLTAAAERLAENGVVSSASVTTCPKRYPVGEQAVVPFESFQEWATEAGVSLGPGFGTRTCYSMETGRRRHYRVLPAFVLAVYEGTRLQAVYPHVDDSPATVPDGLETLWSQGSADRHSEVTDPSAAD